MNYLNDFTIIIVTYKTNKRILYNCLNSIDKNCKSIIVENSNDNQLKKEILKDFENTEVLLSDQNLGYSAGNNLGIKSAKTNYVMISNPDTVYDKAFFKNLNEYINNHNQFSIIGASNKNEKFHSYGSFQTRQNKKLKNLEYDSNGLKEVDWVTGCSMILNLKEVNLENIFDENYFLFYDEIDLCKRIKEKKGKIYTSSKLIVEHFGFKSSELDSTNNISSDKLRNWHLMWSSFYYHKKHYGFIYSLIKNFGVLLRSFLKLNLYRITGDYKKVSIYQSRFSGLINSIRGKKSWYRDS